MDIKTMTIEDLEARKLEISAESDNEGADMSALLEEIRNINAELESRKAELEARKAEEAQKAELRKLVAEGAGQPIKEIKEDNQKMTINEVRAMPEYIEAFANYIKTEDDKECRALLTTNATDGEGITGYVPVPVIVEQRIRTNWEKNGLMELVRKSYIRGNLKIGFELSATGASIHAEGDDEPDEEELIIGVVDLIPASIKKWITVSDEAMDMGGEAFLDYIYDELTYRIAKKAEDELLGLIANAATTATTSAVSVTQLTDDGTDIMGVVYEAVANLSDEAANPVIVMNKLTYAAFKAAQAGANYPVDPFDGLPVFFNNSLTALSGATDDDCWLIVGDFGRGAQANFPNGDEIRIKKDDLSLAEKDLVKFVGREYIALGLVSDKCFTRVIYGTGE